jgi:hypothetical protein
MQTHQFHLYILKIFKVLRLKKLLNSTYLENYIKLYNLNFNILLKFNKVFNKVFALEGVISNYDHNTYKCIFADQYNRKTSFILKKKQHFERIFFQREPSSG